MMRNILARNNARGLIKKYAITDPRQYSLQQIINAEGLLLQYAPLEGCAGSIIFSDKHGIITVSSLLTNIFQQRFTAAHELGHFTNDKKTRVMTSLETQKVFLY